MLSNATFKLIGTGNVSNHGEPHYNWIEEDHYSPFYHLPIRFSLMPATDQGSSLDRYMVIPRTLIFLTHGDYILLLKGGPHKRIWANQYNGIGGHVERGEDILTSAQRELFEETGLSVGDLQLCGVITVDIGEEPGILIFVLRGELDENIPVPESKTLASPEGLLEWVHNSQVCELPLVEDLPLLIPRILASRGVHTLFFAHYAYDDNDQLVIRFTD